MKQTVHVIIQPDGKVKMETDGFKGMQCYDVTEKINLGTTIKDVKKDEAYEKIPRVRRTRIGR